MGVSQKTFRARRRPAHWAAEALRTMQRQHMFLKWAFLHAKAATNIG
jgi:hypothetical protein